MSPPTCPLCGSNDHNEPARHPQARWLCCHCWTIYNGTMDEWNAMRDDRELWQRRSQNPRVGRALAALLNP